MAAQILLSLIQALGYTPETFSAAVEDYRQARVAHSKTIGMPAPTPKIPGLEICIVRTPANADEEESFASAYEIVDDLPPPPKPPTLDEKKMTHASAAHALFQKAINDAIPPLKRRLWAMTYQDIMQKPEADRTDADKVAQRQHEARAKYERDAQRHLARLESEIHDLTDDTVDGWKPEPFDVLF